MSRDLSYRLRIPIALNGWPPQTPTFHYTGTVLNPFRKRVDEHLAGLRLHTRVASRIPCHEVPRCPTTASRPSCHAFREAPNPKSLVPTKTASC